MNARGATLAPSVRAKAVCSQEDARLLPPEFTACTSGVSVRRAADLPTLAIGGSWTDFVVRIHSSGRKDVDGRIELYADGTLIATATGEFGYPSTDGEPVQYFKVGPYRNNDALWGPGPAALEYRNLRRGATAAEVGLWGDEPLVAANAEAPPAD